MSDKARWPRESAMNQAEGLADLLRPHCTRLEIGGSLRRGKPLVGDIELVYVPRFGPQPAGTDLFADERTQCNLADRCIADLVTGGVLARRELADGRTAYGEKNKLMIMAITGIPVDLFATTEECWHNYLVCRTGGAKTNIAICNAAIGRGFKWNPYGSGFTSERNGVVFPMASEREVFEFVGLKYLAPQERF